MHDTWKRVASVALAGALALAGCSGDDGKNGKDAVNTGSISGTVKVSYGTAVPNASVATIPDVGVTATTDAAGVYTLAGLPVGIYTVVVTGTGITRIEVAGVTVLAGVTAAKDVTVVFTPIRVTFASPVAPAGFNKAYTVPAPTVTGGTQPYTYSWTVSGSPLGSTPPTPVTLIGNTTATPGFTTGMFKDVAVKIPTFATATAGYYELPERAGLVALSPQMLKSFTYNLKVRVTDAAGFYQDATVGIPLAMSSQGSLSNGNVPVGMMVTANTATAASYAWTLSKPGGSSAALDDAAIRNPSFTPDVAGTYTLSDGTSTVTVTAAKYQGVARDCGACHAAVPAADAKFKAIYDAWENSAHGNHFWKLMHRDASGALVWNEGAVAEALINDVPYPWTAWASPGRMSLPEYGLSNGEGAHYGESCLGCHAVGFNKLLSGVDGFDDLSFADGGAWSWSTLSAGLSDSGDLTQPNATSWNKLSAGQKARSGIQCENCHGPVAGHNSAANAPRAFFDSNVCATCHDSVGHHDRYMLWGQAGHSNLQLALDEGTSNNCGRCHSAQGFAAWSKQGFNPGYTLAAGEVPAATSVEPQTCVACHDPHTTTLRTDGLTSVAITSGFTVTGGGAGKLCVTCHSSRRGLHNDSIANSSYSLPHAAAQSDVFYGQNAYFLGDLASGAEASVHAFVLEGTCAACHMEIELASDGVYPAPSTTNHSFKPNENVCGKCHEGASFEALAEKTEAGIAALEVEVAEAARRTLPSAGYKLTGVACSDGTTSYTGKATFTSRPDGMAVGLPTGHGTGFALTWTSGVQVTCFAADNTTVDLDPATPGVQPPASDIVFTLAAGTPVGATMSATATTTTAGAAVWTASSDLFKAVWNMALVEDEGSRGAHNPAFVQKVLTISLAKAKAIPAVP
jgi:hypothetical protein